MRGVSARKFASQGQQRAAAITLLLGIVDAVEKRTGARPAVLLDDVSSELDANHRRRLFSRVQALGGQVLVTTTEPGGVGDRPGTRRWIIRDGRVEQESGA